MTIEERIEVTGAGQAERDVRRVADATENAGRQAEGAGKEAGRGAEGFDDLGSSATSAGDKLGTFASSMFGLDALLNLVTKISAKLGEIVELRRALADQSTAALETVLPLAEQHGDLSQTGLKQALKDATQLRKAAVMSSLSAATSLGVAADINLPGGFDSTEDAEAYARNLGIAGAVGGSIPLGTEATYGGIFEILKAADITDPDQIKLELARIISIQQASQSANLGSFVAGMASSGMKSFLAGGGTLQDAAILLLKAREASANDAIAMTTADVLLRASRGSTATRDFLAGKSREFGFGDFDTLTDTQRLALLEQTFVQAQAGGPEAMAGLLRQGFEPGQFPLMSAAFAPSSRTTATTARASAAQARAAEIDKKIRDFRQSQIGLERTQQADIEFAEAVAGIDVYSISKLRELAEHREMLRITRPGVRGGEIAEATLSDPEPLIEREAMTILWRRVAELEAQGVDVSGATASLYRAERGNIILPSLGVPDELLRLANEAVNQAIKQAGEKALTGGAPVQVVNNVTHMGSVYLDRNPERLTEDIPDVGD